MKEFFKSDKGIILCLTIFFFALLPFFYLKQGLLLIDTGREFYLPQQMLNGSVLYKDLYNMYGTLSYQFNALLMAIFGQKITTLYWAGIINSLVIIITTYLLSRKFLDKILSSLISIFIIFALVYNTFLYNSNITYSYAIVYALSSFLISILFLVKYLKEEDKTHFAYISCLLAGISLANKYEFVLYPIVLFLSLLIAKPLKIKDFIYSILCFCAIPFLSFGSLFLQGFTFEDTKNTLLLFKSSLNAPTIKIFFSNFGSMFDANKYLSIIRNGKSSSLLGLLPILNTVLFIIFFKKIYQNKPLLIALLCLIVASAKSFLFLNVEHMGAFLLPLCIIAICIYLSQSKITKKISIILLLLLTLDFALRDFSSLEQKSYLLETKKGNIYTYKKDGSTIKHCIDILQRNNAESAMVLPEGAFINFATDIKGNNQFYSLIPLIYLDIFGEEKVLTDVKNNLPEFVIILPIDTSEYGYKYFGIDYAQNFYEMIKDNYELIDEHKQIQTYKRKN